MEGSLLPWTPQHHQAALLPKPFSPSPTLTTHPRPQAPLAPGTLQHPQDLGHSPPAQHPQPPKTHRTRHKTPAPGTPSTWPSPQSPQRPPAPPDTSNTPAPRPPGSCPNLPPPPLEPQPQDPQTCTGILRLLPQVSPPASHTAPHPQAHQALARHRRHHMSHHVGPPGQSRPCWALQLQWTGPLHPPRVSTR